MYADVFQNTPRHPSANPTSAGALLFSPVVDDVSCDAAAPATTIATATGDLIFSDSFHFPSAAGVSVRFSSNSISHHHTTSDEDNAENDEDEVLNDFHVDLDSDNDDEALMGRLPTRMTTPHHHQKNQYPPHSHGGNSAETSTVSVGLVPSRAASPTKSSPNPSGELGLGYVWIGYVPPSRVRELSPFLQSLKGIRFTDSIGSCHGGGEGSHQQPQQQQLQRNIDFTFFLDGPHEGQGFLCFHTVADAEDAARTFSSAVLVGQQLPLLQLSLRLSSVAELERAKEHYRYNKTPTAAPAQVVSPNLVYWLRGLPFQAQRSDVEAFLKDVDFNKLDIGVLQSGECSGNAFVELNGSESQQVIENLHNTFIPCAAHATLAALDRPKPRFVEVILSSEAKRQEQLSADLNRVRNTAGHHGRTRVPATKPAARQPKHAQQQQQQLLRDVAQSQLLNSPNHLNVPSPCAPVLAGQLPPALMPTLSVQQLQQQQFQQQQHLQLQQQQQQQQQPLSPLSSHYFLVPGIPQTMATMAGEGNNSTNNYNSVNDLRLTSPNNYMMAGDVVRMMPTLQPPQPPQQPQMQLQQQQHQQQFCGGMMLGGGVTNCVTSMVADAPHGYSVSYSGAVAPSQLQAYPQYSNTPPSSFSYYAAPPRGM